ncbi:5-formyltetrahydrofolate cyclo-ligase [Verrucomicrobia bacterium S94]|nr:5-formyltetrahydrofolate cyclo-ligase [Verrucomicrobia bacterium S94]
MTTKHELRRQVGKKRAALDAEWLKTASASLIRQFRSLDIFKTSKTVALYKAIGGEVNLEPLFEHCWSLGKRTAIPVFNANSRVYEMAEISSSTQFRTGNYGIPEPVSPERLPLSAINLIIVPGVAFDLAGNRLGRGGGYYDRMLSVFSGSTVGVCFDFQWLETVPVDPHDQPVDFVVTETKCGKVPNEH